MYVLTANYKKSDASQIFVESLKKTGFAVVKNHPIDINLVKTVYKEWEDFFNSADKHAFNYNVETQDGFFPGTVSEVAKNHTIKDLKEFYHFFPWGKCPEKLKKNTQALYTHMSDLAGILLSWIENHTPDDIKINFSKKLSDMIKNSPRTLLRILYYPALTGDEEPDAVRAAAHEDIDLLTLLPAATTTGLQVKDKQGNWHEVESDPGTIVVNVGDMLQECSGHYYQSTTHRVINPIGEDAKKPRLSMPLFLHPTDDVKLSDKYTAHSYLIERLKELGIY